MSDLKRRGIALSEERKQMKRTVTAQLISAFVFAYAEIWFSHEAAHKCAAMVI